MVVRIPQGQGNNEVVVSVLDPTWAKKPFTDFDQTYRRIGTAITVVKNAGKLLGVANPQEEAIDLARQFVARLKVPINERDPSLLSDYISIAKIENAGREKPLTLRELLTQIAERIQGDKLPNYLALLGEASAVSGRNRMLPPITAPLYGLYNQIDFSDGSPTSAKIATSVRRSLNLEGLTEADFAIRYGGTGGYRANLAIALKSYYQMGEYPQGRQLELTLKALDQLENSKMWVGRDDIIQNFRDGLNKHLEGASSESITELT